MCVKFPPENLSFGSCASHPTSTYTYGVTIVLRMCSGSEIEKVLTVFSIFEKMFPKISDLTSLSLSLSLYIYIYITASAVSQCHLLT